MERASISIDVDAIGCYHAIHGLSAPEQDPIYSHALPRFLDAMRTRGLSATLFVVGQDLDDDAHRQCIADAAAQGHEIASHSHRHDYGMSQSPRAEIDADLERANAAIEDACGKRPRGFRAPGYNQSEALLDAVEAAGMLYDSSYFPTPAYFAARAAAIGLYRVKGRPSHSLVGDVREFAAPRTPFRPARGARYRPARRGEEARELVELPMAVSSRLRLPWLGTTIALANDRVSSTLTKRALHFRKGPVVLELHAMEFLGADDGVDPALIAAQPDLQVPLDDKLRRLGAAFDAMAAAKDVVTMEELATEARATL